MHRLILLMSTGAVVSCFCSVCGACVVDAGLVSACGAAGNGCRQRELRLGGTGESELCHSGSARVVERQYCVIIVSCILACLFLAKHVVMVWLMLRVASVCVFV